MNSTTHTLGRSATIVITSADLAFERLLLSVVCDAVSNEPWLRGYPGGTAVTIQPTYAPGVGRTIEEHRRPIPITPTTFGGASNSARVTISLACDDPAVEQFFVGVVTRAVAEEVLLFGEHAPAVTVLPFGQVRWQSMRNARRAGKPEGPG